MAGCISQQEFAEGFSALAEAWNACPACSGVWTDLASVSGTVRISPIIEALSRVQGRLQSHAFATHRRPLQAGKQQVWCKCINLSRCLHVHGPYLASLAPSITQL